jgi:hypothetical protein
MPRLTSCQDIARARWGLHFTEIYLCHALHIGATPLKKVATGWAVGPISRAFVDLYDADTLDSPAAVSRALPSWIRSTLTEILPMSRLFVSRN